MKNKIKKQEMNIAWLRSFKAYKSKSEEELQTTLAFLKDFCSLIYDISTTTSKQLDYENST